MSKFLHLWGRSFWAGTFKSLDYRFLSCVYGAFTKEISVDLKHNSREDEQKFMVLKVIHTVLVRTASAVFIYCFICDSYVRYGDESRTMPQSPVNQWAQCKYSIALGMV